MKRIKPYIFASILVFVVSLVLLTSGCSDYHYGVKRDAPSLQFKQTDPSYIKGDYEFQSILFKSADGNLVINLQHPLPEPEKFISQIGFNLTKSGANDFFVKEVSLVHIDAKGVWVKPQERFIIPGRIRQEIRFYVSTYSRSSLTSELTEAVKVRFIYRGKEHEISFREEVRLVKRWNKLMAGRRLG